MPARDPHTARQPNALVSVVIAAFNAERFLREAIDSVLAQTYRPLEIIVVNDGSTDATQAVIDGFSNRVLAIMQPNAGRSAARNAGAARAAGAYLAFLDADDVFAPEKLALQVPAMEGNPDLALVASGLNVVDVAGHVERVVRPWAHHPEFDEERLTYIGLIGLHGMLLRRNWFDRVGGFDDSLHLAEDMDLAWRIWAAGGPMAWLTAIVGDYRIHEDNSSHRVLEHHHARLALLQRQLDTDKLTAAAVARAPDVVALLKVGAAGRLYGLGRHDRAHQLLLGAIRLSPMLLDNDGLPLLDAIAGWRDDPWIGNRGRILETALAGLPPSLDWIASRRGQIETRLWRRRFYHAAVERDAVLLRRAWLHVAARHLRWLLNRGSWSLLFRSLLWRSPFGTSPPAQAILMR